MPSPLYTESPGQPDMLEGTSISMPAYYHVQRFQLDQHSWSLFPTSVTPHVDLTTWQVWEKSPTMLWSATLPEPFQNKLFFFF